MPARYWVGGGSSNAWNATAPTNWSATSGGANNASVPTSADDVIFDGAGANGNDNSTISATITILSLDITTGYTATMTHDAVLTIAGNWTYTGNYTIAGASGITISAASTITSNGVTWPNALTFRNSVTRTLVGDLTIAGQFTTSGNSVINSTTSEKLICNNGITIDTASPVTGTVEMYLKGGAWSTGNTPTRRIDTKLFIDGNVTISQSVGFGGSTFTYLSGTVTTTGSTLIIPNGISVTLDTNGINWNNVTMSTNTVTVNLTSDLYIYGLLTSGISSGVLNVDSSNSSVVYAYGGINNEANRALRGTASVYFRGGTWTCGANSFISNPLFIDGDVIFNGTVTKSGGTLTYLSGTLTLTGSTLAVIGATLNVSPVTWNNVTLAGSTSTLTSDLNVGGLTTISSGTTLNRTTAEVVNLYGGFTTNASHGGNANIYIKGGIWNANSAAISDKTIYLDGDCTVISTVNLFRGSTISYLSGDVNALNGGIGMGFNLSPTVVFIDTKTVFWSYLVMGPYQPQYTLLSDLYVVDLVQNRVNLSAGSYTIYIHGQYSHNSNYNYGPFRIVFEQGSSWVSNVDPGSSGSQQGSLGGNIVINGNMTIRGNIGVLNGAVITYIKGNIDASNAKLVCTGNVQLYNFGKINFREVNVGSGLTLTMNEFFNGTPNRSCRISIGRASGSIGTTNYNINFTDGFEKIAKFVQIVNANISRPQQLLVITNSRFNTGIDTNAPRIRYYNQLPNGVAKNSPNIVDTMTVPALGLVNDPCFQYA